MDQPQSNLCDDVHSVPDFLIQFESKICENDIPGYLDPSETLLDMLRASNCPFSTEFLNSLQK